MFAAEHTPIGSIYATETDQGIEYVAIVYPPDFPSGSSDGVKHAWLNERVEARRAALYAARSKRRRQLVIDVCLVSWVFLLAALMLVVARA